MKESIKNFDDFEVIKSKGDFPYELITSEKILDAITTFPSKEKFFSMLKGKNIDDDNFTDERYNRAKKIFEKYCKTLRDYMELYLKLDVCQLSDFFEKFRETIFNQFGLDPVYFVTISSLTFSAALKHTKIELECISDPTMFNFIERAKRGGVSMIVQKHAHANNKYMRNFDPKKPSTFIVYLDANNLYGFCMKKSLPTGNFRWIDPKKYDENKQDAFVELDIEKVSKELFHKFREFPLCPTQESGKLLNTLKEKKGYICHSEYMKHIRSLGYKFKVKSVLGFDSSPWLESYIEKCTQCRIAATTDIDKKFFKQMINSIYGKTLENVRIRKNIYMGDEIYKIKKQSKSHYVGDVQIDSDLYLIQMGRRSIYMDKPIYVGVTILDFAKIHMDNFFYNYIKKKFGNRSQLLMTDTDSLVLYIQSEDFFKEIENDVEEWFDTSDIPKGTLYDTFPIGKNKKIPGLFKDEKKGIIITDFYSDSPKSYFIKVQDSLEKEKENREKMEKVLKEKEKTLSKEELEKEKKLLERKLQRLREKRVGQKTLKGFTQQAKDQFTEEDFRLAAEEGKTKTVDMVTIVSEEQTCYTISQSKTAFGKDEKGEKRIFSKDGTSVPFGWFD